MIITIIIDAFRAFATAAYALEKRPKTYFLTNNCAVVARLASSLNAPFLIGKPEKGSNLLYDIPNSPTRIEEAKIANRNVIHRTEAGAKGILEAKQSDLILGVGFVNADATASYIKQLTKPQVKIIPMGHEGITPSLEDHLCAQYIESLLKGKTFHLSSFIHKLKKGPGRYFFGEDQWQYPETDFQLCLNIKRFSHVIQAQVKGDFAYLTIKHVEHSLIHPLKTFECPSLST